MSTQVFMKKILLILTIVFFASSLVFLFPEEGKSKNRTYKYRAMVNRIIDGDSIKVFHNGKQNSIRLYGIDTPEWGQPFSRRPKNYLKKLLLNEEVLIEPLYTDAYSRTIALVYFKEQNVNQLLVEKGLAWVHIYYCKKEICETWKDLERQARMEESGLWQDDKPVPPWVWKKYNK